MIQAEAKERSLMRMLCLLFLAVFAMPLPVHAEGLSSDLAACATIEDGSRRLECYDALAQREKEAADLAKKEPWFVSQYASKLDDSQNVFLSASAMAPFIDRDGRPHWPSLCMRCSENKTFAYVIWDIPLGSHDLKVTERLDQQKAEEATWEVSSDRKACFRPSAVAFLKSLVRHNKLLLQVVPENDTAQTAEFSLEGLAKAIAPLRKACGW